MLRLAMLTHRIADRTDDRTGGPSGGPGVLGPWTRLPLRAGVNGHMPDWARQQLRERTRK